MSTACECTDLLQVNCGICLRKRWCQLAGSQQVGKRKRKRPFHCRPAEHLTGFNTEQLESGMHRNSVWGQEEAEEHLPQWCHDTRSRQPGPDVPTDETMTHYDFRFVWSRLPVKDTKCQNFLHTCTQRIHLENKTKQEWKRKDTVGVWTLDKGAQHKAKICVLPPAVISLPTTGKKSQRVHCFCLCICLCPSLAPVKCPRSPHEFILPLPLCTYVYSLSPSPSN